MHVVRFTMPLFFIVLSVAYGMLIIQLPQATLGDPMAPFYFPIAICIGLFLFAVIDLVQVVKKKEHQYEEDVALLVRKSTIKTIAVIVTMCVVYTLMFEYTGFLLSTILFLAMLLFYLNGKRKWVMNVLVTGIVSISAWFIFSYLLEISLPGFGG
ncbi:tripartite tricarboxylate transporter TctB family protein [Alkalihalobacillus sp. LMS6]|uniref:tripartite tricarboxylate transporter TctB family protein n=1 Tax=Alkalihalobacillus sp. LMS6 TaxID=2924034 RepID=UPI0020D0A36A|nr:tripartite tricarboxylate transporter TctB family protein [Alkalihalobacillus sp. LMS6]UTR06215.1 tripartite tricarboxylate transporter TctB family protein [Alkalihalobacillus sp. LMS6]